MDSKHYVRASTLKRTLSFIIDLFLAFLVFFSLTILTSQPVFNSVGGKAARDNMISYFEDSGLFVIDAERTSIDYHKFNPRLSSGDYTAEPSYQYGYQAYEDIVWNYYVSFRPEMSAEDVLKNVYKFADDGSGNLYYQLVDWSSRPILKSEVDLNDEQTIVGLRDYYYLDKNGSGYPSSGIYRDAILRFLNTKEYASYNDKIQTASVIASIPAVVGTMVLVFVMFPLVLPNGKSVGKLLFRLNVVDKDGFRIKNRGRFALRDFLKSLPLLILLIPNQSTALMFLVFAYVLLMILMNASRDKLAVHEKITKTMLIESSKEMPVFDNMEEAEAYLKEHEVHEPVVEEAPIEEPIIEAEVVEEKAEEVIEEPKPEKGEDEYLD